MDASAAEKPLAPTYIKLDLSANPHIWADFSGASF
jgi:hypothetical protein